MEQKKLTKQELRQISLNKAVDSLLNQNITPFKFMMNGATKIQEKAYRMDFLEDTAAFTCDALIVSHKCDGDCESCWFQQIENQVAYEILSGARQNIKYAYIHNPRIPNHTKLNNHMTVRDLKRINTVIRARQKIEGIKLLMQGKPCKKNNVVANI